VPPAGCQEQGTLPPDDADLAQAYDEHVWHVYGFFAYRLGTRADAEDLTQLTFERAVRAWSRFDPARSSVATWLIAIARNLLIDHYRATGRVRLESIEADAGREPHALTIDGPETDLGLSAELEAALEQLTEREREAIALRFGADLTGPQVAEVMHLTLGNVQQILSRALRKLRAQLEAAETAPAPQSASER
jgi:RNA polymerase sigma-70 factor (ECF subfamily)